MRKAAVFPDPVWAQAIRSRPPQTMGTECFCTGVNLLYPIRAQLFRITSPKSRSASSATDVGTSFPVASTGMSSYLSKLIPAEMWPWSNSSVDAEDDELGERVELREPHTMPQQNNVAALKTTPISDLYVANSDRHEM
jgi:hypothetical protein